MNVSALQPVIEALGWTLVHFLWQGAVIGLMFALVLRLSGAASSKLRYRASLLLFLGAGLAPVVTFWMVYESAAGPAAPLGGIILTSAAGGGASGAVPWWLALESTLEPYLPWAVALWLAGVIVMSGRVCLDWWQVRRLTWVGVAPLPAHWEENVAELVRTFGVSRPVRVLRSAVVRVPAVIGWLRPVVLLPTAALAGLSARQLELIIAHELAHIRRADYLVNLLQVVIETVLFYHPAVRWMSNRLRQERELCCDDAVIATCGDTLTYAQALTELEAQRQQSFQTALAASGGQLSQRIYRMLDHPVPRRNTLVWSMSLVVGLAAGSMAVAAQFALSSAGHPAPVVEPRAESPLPTPGPAAGTVPPRLNEPAGASAPATRQRPETGDRGENLETAAAPRPVTGETGSAAGPAAPRARDSAQPDAAEAPNRGSGPATEPADSREAVAAAAESETPAQDRQGDGGQVVAADPQADERPEPPEKVRVASARPSGQEAAEPGPAAEPPRPAAERAARAPIRLARAAPQQTKASSPPKPEVRGGEPLHVVAPEYPRRARIRGLQGSVTAVFTIGRAGRVRDVEIAESSPAGVFDRSVSEALAEWRFRPMTRDGEAVARRVSKQFEFNLADSRGVRSLEEDTCDPVTGTRICSPWSAADELAAEE